MLAHSAFLAPAEDVFANEPTETERMFCVPSELIQSSDSVHLSGVVDAGQTLATNDPVQWWRKTGRLDLSEVSIGSQRHR